MIVVRPAGPADLPLLQGVEDAADALLVAALRPDAWQGAGDGAARAAVPGVLLVAEDAEAGVIGFAHVLRVDGAFHLEQLSVLPAHARRGAGRALVERAKAAAAAAGAERLTLRTYAHLPWNAPFYATCGFAASEPDTAFLRGLVAVEHRLGLDRWGPRVQMTAPLAPAD